MCFLRYKMLIVLYVVNKTTWVGFSCSRWSFDYSYLRSTQSFGWMFEFVFWIGWIIKYIEYNPKNKHVHVTNYFWPKFTTGRKKKDPHFRYTTHITRTSRVWQAILGTDDSGTSYSRKMVSGSIFFTKSALDGDL